MKETIRVDEISAFKILSANDLGLTGTHQSGLLIPKKLISGNLFPSLSKSELNPRMRLKFITLDDDKVFYANYIYYNNRHFSGTRDEYRLTGISGFLRENGLKEEDKIKISKQGLGTYSICVIKEVRDPSALSVESWELIYGGRK